MIISRRFERPNLLVATLQGVVRAADQVELLEWVRASIRRAGPVRVLIALEAFGGWKPDSSLESVTSWLEDDEGVVKMAFVGKSEWRLRVLTLVAQPVRRLPISYFETQEAARAWLESDEGIATAPRLGQPRTARHRV